MYKKYRVVSLWLFGAFILDRLTKWFAVSWLSDGDMLVFPGFNLTLVYNRGVSFGMLHFTHIQYFILTSVLVGVVLVLFGWYAYKELCRGGNAAPEGLVLVGALSNMIDRFVYGGVVDFIHLYVDHLHWPVFNFADMYVVIGIGCIIWKWWHDGNARKA